MVSAALLRPGVKSAAKFVRMLAAGLALAPALLCAAEEAVDPRAWDGRLETMHDYAAPSSLGKTPLMQAAGDGDIAKARALLEAGAEVDARNANEGTALMYAVSAGDTAMVQLLLATGANPNARARIGWTPMLVAAAKGRHTVVPILLEAGADPAETDAYGWTPLMRAVSSGYLRAVDAILASGRADLQAREESGATALHIAAGRGYAPIVRRLLEAGAEPGAADGEGRTPADVARLQGHGEAEALLRSRGHRPG